MIRTLCLWETSRIERATRPTGWFAYCEVRTTITSTRSQDPLPDFVWLDWSCETPSWPSPFTFAPDLHPGTLIRTCRVIRAMRGARSG